MSAAREVKARSARRRAIAPADARRYETQSESNEAER
jgi:hypothetical protein